MMMRGMSREDFSPLTAAASPRTALLSPQDYFGENQRVTGEPPGLLFRMNPGLESCFGLIGRNADLR